MNKSLSVKELHNYGAATQNIYIFNAEEQNICVIMSFETLPINVLNLSD